MSDTSQFNFGKFVPGFDFLQNLGGTAAQGASGAGVAQMPSMGSWVAPTMNVEDLDKRIDELKTVQFWLDQNAMALKATIQALEVQKMTLATLKGMNFNMGDLANVFKFNPPVPVPTPVAPKAAEPVAAQPAAAASTAAEPVQPPAGGVVDPMAWWGSLTQQFQNIAASAVKDAAKQAAFDPANNPAVNLAKDAFNAATDMAKVASKSVANSAIKSGANAKNKSTSVVKKAAPAATPKASPKVASKAVPKKAIKKPVK
jgi:hypothetical protein